MTYETIKDQQTEGSWRVEAIDYENEGVAYVAIFAGPDSERRAKEYANWKNSLQQNQRAA
jgi:hypothetical protein